MKDFFKREIKVGDIVAFNAPGYKHLITGEVVKINSKMLRLAYGEPKSRLGNKREETNEYPSDVVVKV